MNVMQLLLKKYKRKINKVIKGGSILSILFSILFSLVIPPFNIYADTLSMSNIVGINYTVSNSIVVGSVTYNNISYNRYSTDYDVEIKLDDSYLGWCQLTIEYDFYDRDSTGVISKNTNVTRRIYINGDTAHIDINIYNNYSSQPLIVLISNPRVTTITNSNVVPYGDLATLEDILSVLNDIYVNVSVDLYGELEDIVNAVGLSNQYLDTISRIRQYNIFPESYLVYSYMLQNHYSKIIDNNYYYNYPLFRFGANESFYRWRYFPANRSYVFILICESLSRLSYDTNKFTISDSELLLSYPYTEYKTLSLFKFTITNNSSSTEILDISVNSDTYLCPIAFINSRLIKNVSTDFALIFGLSNSLLDNLQTIANGTNQSNQSSSSLETQKNSFDTTSNSLYTSENAFNTDMNSKLQSIDTSFNPSTSFGSKFLSSADWVRTQFDNITSTTPFGTVLSFSMLLGLSLLIIGKVFK